MVFAYFQHGMIFSMKIWLCGTFLQYLEWRPSVREKGLMCWKNDKKVCEMKILGLITAVIPEYGKEESSEGHRIFVKMVSYDDLLREQQVYMRVQGRKALMVLEAMDETGFVSGLWQADFSVSVKEIPGKNHVVYVNLLHCTDLELVDAGFPEPVDMADRATAAEVVPLVIDGEEQPCVLSRKWNWKALLKYWMNSKKCK